MCPYGNLSHKHKQMHFNKDYFLEFCNVYRFPYANLRIFLEFANLKLRLTDLQTDNQCIDDRTSVIEDRYLGSMSKKTISQLI